MPLHLDALTNEHNQAELLSHIFQVELNACESVYVTEDKKFIHLSKRVCDVKTNEEIGRFVFTILSQEKALEILDVDFVLQNPSVTEMKFIERLDGSSDANEYYNVQLVDNDAIGQIETVNRHTITEDILNTTREVSISAFPFQLNIYSDIKALNLAMGFNKNGVKLGKTDTKVSGFSPRFVSPGNISLLTSDLQKKCSFLIGSVKSFKNIATQWAKQQFDFVITMLDTGFGVIPVAMNRQYFDLGKLKEGATICMLAYIKADFAITGNAT